MSDWIRQKTLVKIAACVATGGYRCDVRGRVSSEQEPQGQTVIDYKAR